MNSSVFVRITIRMRNNKVERMVAVSKTSAIKYVYSCCFYAQKPLRDLKWQSYSQYY